MLSSNSSTDNTKSTEGLSELSNNISAIIVDYLSHQHTQNDTNNTSVSSNLSEKAVGRIVALNIQQCLYGTREDIYILAAAEESQKLRDKGAIALAQQFYSNFSIKRLHSGIRK